MSIITKQGDNGTTSRLFGRKASKASTIIEAIGALDELNAWIGLAAKVSDNGWQGTTHIEIQRDLVSIMGELSAGSQWYEAYNAKFGSIGQDRITALEEIVKELEKDRKFTDWANPSTHWDVACRVCRRAERALYRHTTNPNALGDKVRKEVLIYINRLSDLLWIWGRK